MVESPSSRIFGGEKGREAKKKEGGIRSCHQPFCTHYCTCIVLEMLRYQMPDKSEKEKKSFIFSRKFFFLPSSTYISETVHIPYSCQNTFYPLRYSTISDLGYAGSTDENRIVRTIGKHKKGAS